MPFTTTITPHLKWSYSTQFHSSSGLEVMTHAIPSPIVRPIVYGFRINASSFQATFIIPTIFITASK